MILKGTSFSSFGCFVFKIWVLRLRDLGALGASCFGLRFRVLCFRNYPDNEYISLVTKRPSVGKINIVLKNFA